MSIFIITTIHIERDRCKMQCTVSRKQGSVAPVITGKQRVHVSVASEKRSASKIKPSYTVIHHGGEIYLYNNATQKKEVLNGKSVDKIPPGAKITIKQNGMSRVQIASILDLILGSNSPY